MREGFNLMPVDSNIIKYPAPPITALYFICGEGSIYADAFKALLMDLGFRNVVFTGLVEYFALPRFGYKSVKPKGKVIALFEGVSPSLEVMATFGMSRCHIWENHSLTIVPQHMQLPFSLSNEIRYESSPVDVLPDLILWLCKHYTVPESKIPKALATCLSLTSPVSSAVIHETLEKLESYKRLYQL